MHNLSNLTIIILSYNRHQSALRILQYWSGKSVRVHLLDGSDNSMPASHLEGLESNISYHHVPRSYSDRLKMGATFVQTEYTALLCDDEFFLPSALQACIDELDEDPSLVACAGRALGFKIEKGQVVGYPVYKEMENYAVLGEDPVDRVLFHMTNYTISSIYSIVKTPVWKSVVAVVTEKQFPVFGLFELQFEMAVCFHGKSKIIPYVMWLRSFENEPIRGDVPSFTPENTFIKWWLDIDKSQERKDLLVIMAQHLEQVTNTGFERIYDGTQHALDAYASNLQTRKGARTHKQTDDFRSARVRSFLKLIPPWVKHAVRPYLTRSKRLHNLTETKLLHQAGRALADTGCSLNDGELVKIERSILKFHSSTN